MLHPSVKQSAQSLFGAATSSPTRQLISILALTSATALAMLAFRLYYGGTWGYRSLPWDLFLAWLPVPLAMAMAHCHARARKPWPMTLLLGTAWLLFFPNAPYLVTQFMHLHPSYAVYEGP